jgi:hypothetical protein
MSRHSQSYTLSLSHQKTKDAVMGMGGLGQAPVSWFGPASPTALEVSTKATPSG